LRLGRLTGEERVHTTPLVTACLSLLAFMLAIVYSAVDSRFSELKHVVLDEANAIGTAFLRADLLPNADRVEVRQLLQDYVNLRIEAMQNGEKEQIEQTIDKSEKLQNDLWSKAVTIANQQPTPVSALFLQSLNELIDMHEKRITVGIHHRLPIEIWTMLYGLAILALAMGGYDSGLHGSRRVIAITVTAAVAFSVVLTLVIALDRSHHRLSASIDAPMVDVQEDIRRSIQSQP
ncbi:MAG: hypothetical protein QNI91_17535, partial [Arenicellales bacterium]|nr:hypothetical protein [Arenicellales bacterium]